jgi:hypothetical protein
MHDSSLVTLYSVLVVSEIPLAIVLTTVIMIHVTFLWNSFLVQSFVHKTGISTDLQQILPIILISFFPANHEICSKALNLTRSTYKTIISTILEMRRHCCMEVVLH